MITLTCRQCHKEFAVYPSQITKGRAYCSKTCADSSKTADKSSCLQCGKILKRCNAKFCSIPCRDEWSIANNTREGTISCACIVCGALFTRKRAEVTSGYDKYCSRGCMGFHRSKSVNFTGHSRSVGGKRADLNDKYFRSAWESNWARYLNWLQSLGEIRGWEYEPKTFEFATIKRGNRFYTPDFKVTEKDGSVIFHEVKGWMDASSKTKLARMKEFHPGIRIRVIDASVYRPISIKMRNLLPNWEIHNRDKHAW